MSLKATEEFEAWLELEYPCHNEYDHATLGHYHSWLAGQRTAFFAGWNARKVAAYREVLRHDE